jgi:hypothetical protein
MPPGHQSAEIIASLHVPLRVWVLGQAMFARHAFAPFFAMSLMLRILMAETRLLS